MINNNMNKDQSLAVVFIHGAGLGSWIWRDVSPLMHSLILAIDFPKRDKSFEERKSLTLNGRSWRERER